MPHYKCVACRVRVRVLQEPADSATESCPQCGLPMDAVSDPSEAIGFRRFESVNNDIADYAVAIEAAAALLDGRSTR